jgi:hypothetical protein
MRFRLHGIYLFIIAALFLLTIGGALYILVTDYDALIASVAASVHKNGLEEKIRNGIFTRSRFSLLQKMCWLIFIISPFCFWLAIRYRVIIIRYCSFLFITVLQSVKAIKAVFKNNSRPQNQSVFTLISITILFFSYHMATSFLSYDEMWSYNYYTANHFFYSFFTYSSYPLFEMTTHLFKWFPFPMKINLRLSPFIFGIASFFLLYACLRKYFNSHFIAMAGLAAFAFMPLTAMFIVNARGVMHELLFAIAGIFSFLFWLNRPDQKKYMAIYFLAGVLGLYSMTTHILFLFFILVTGLFGLIKKDKASFFLFIKINLLIIAGFIIIYAPIFITTGISVFGNVVKSTPSYDIIIKSMPNVVRNIFVDYASYNNAGIIIFLTAILAAALLRNKLRENSRIVLVFAVGLPLSTLFFYLITGFPYAGRSLAFGALAIPLLACLFAQMVEPWIKKNSVWEKRAGYSVIGLALLLDAYSFFPIYPFDKNVADVSRLLINRKVVSCYDNSSAGTYFFYYYPGIEYYYRMESKTIEFTLSAKNSMRYKPLLANDQYDCIVYNSNMPDNSRAPGFSEMYRDPFGKFTIWVRNDLK